MAWNTHRTFISTLDVLVLDKWVSLPQPGFLFSRFLIWRGQKGEGQFLTFKVSYFRGIRVEKVLVPHLLSPVNLVSLLCPAHAPPTSNFLVRN